jgi:hypothetical protein
MELIGKLLKSKTIIVNSLTVVVGVLGYLQGHEVIAAYPGVVAGLVATSGVLNVALRFVTTIPVWEK